MTLSREGFAFAIAAAAGSQGYDSGLCYLDLVDREMGYSFAAFVAEA